MFRHVDMLSIPRRDIICGLMFDIGRTASFNMSSDTTMTTIPPPVVFTLEWESEVRRTNDAEREIREQEMEFSLLFGNSDSFWFVHFE
jgi:hypothetical protein